MAPPKYSSVAAFLAHLSVLEGSASRTADDERSLTVMRGVLAELSNHEREALSDQRDTSATCRRHRERAELKLSRVLTSRGLLAS